MKFTDKASLKVAVNLYTADIVTAKATYGVINDWDVSEITDMAWLFSDFPTFNEDISSWDVSNVVNMSSLFSGSSSFNGDISSWDVGNVTDMRSMFFGNSVFNQYLSSWNVGKVTNMDHMFTYCYKFNGDISTWNVSNVTSMQSMFLVCLVFNSDISGWDVGNVTNMSEMFSGCAVFNSDISGWDVSNVVNMYEMFRDASAFNQDIRNWNVTNTQADRLDMFYRVNYSYDLSHWEYLARPLVPLVNMGGTASCSPNCGVCTGDCDGDEDCAVNLKCFQRESSTSQVPGCLIGGAGDVGTHDYCYNPSLEFGTDYDTMTTQNDGTTHCESYCSSGWNNEAAKGSTCVKAANTKTGTLIGCDMQSSGGLTCYCKNPAFQMVSVDANGKNKQYKYIHGISDISQLTSSLWDAAIDRDTTGWNQIVVDNAEIAEVACERPTPQGCDNIAQVPTTCYCKDPAPGYNPDVVTGGGVKVPYTDLNTDASNKLPNTKWWVGSAAPYYDFPECHIPYDGDCNWGSADANKGLKDGDCCFGASTCVGGTCNRHENVWNYAHDRRGTDAGGCDLQPGSQCNYGNGGCCKNYTEQGGLDWSCESNRCVSTNDEFNTMQNTPIPESNYYYWTPGETDKNYTIDIITGLVSVEFVAPSLRFNLLSSITSTTFTVEVRGLTAYDFIEDDFKSRIRKSIYKETNVYVDPMDISLISATETNEVSITNGYQRKGLNVYVKLFADYDGDYNDIEKAAQLAYLVCPVYSKWNDYCQNGNRNLDQDLIDPGTHFYQRDFIDKHCPIQYRPC